MLFEYFTIVKRRNVCKEDKERKNNIFKLCDFLQLMSFLITSIFLHNLPPVTFLKFCVDHNFLHIFLLLRFSLSNSFSSPVCYRFCSCSIIHSSSVIILVLLIFIISSILLVLICSNLDTRLWVSRLNSTQLDSRLDSSPVVHL